jgi:hypothetical protein
MAGMFPDSFYIKTSRSGTEAPQTAKTKLSEPGKIFHLHLCASLPLSLLLMLNCLSHIITSPQVTHGHRCSKIQWYGKSERRGARRGLREFTELETIYVV